jgi:hypothetical protein
MSILRRCAVMTLRRWSRESPQEKQLDLLLIARKTSMFALSSCRVADKQTSPHLAL